MDHPSCQCDGILLTSDELMMYLEQSCSCGATTSTSSSPSSHVISTMSISETGVSNNHHFGKSDHKLMTLKKPKTTVAKRKTKAANKCEHNDKRKPRNVTISSLSLSDETKVGKQTMGEGIGRLHRLVSPLGKADTASVLSECIEYIRFLHEQVTVLSNTNTATNMQDIQHFQDLDDCLSNQCVLSSDVNPASLRSRGLCIAPVFGALLHTKEITWAIGKQDLESKEFHI